ncbi:Glutamate--cysteine ligase [Streptomyces hirsutus]
MRSVGVEEELLLVDPNSGEPVAVAGAALAAADRRTWQHGGDGAKDRQFEGELQQEQMEFATAAGDGDGPAPGGDHPLS